ncbi:DNA-directed RNA polymerase [Cryptosporidium felis]|nr:DNA-directed RNA polymerase [Cryptosporidium felis]
MNSAPICSDIHSASFELLRASEVKKLSVCHVTSTTTFETTGESKVGGLHDLRMGPLNNRDFCGTCGNRNDCPGHLGHIELELPVFHPLFLSKLVKILKCSCWHCCCIRLSKKVCDGYIKRFKSIRSESEENSQDVATSGKNLENGTDFTAIDGYTLETWENIKNEFLNRAIKFTSCSSCGNSFKGKVRESQLGVGITLSWPEGTKPPVSLGSTWNSNSNLDMDETEGASDSESGSESVSENGIDYEDIGAEADSENQRDKEGELQSSQSSNESGKRKLSELKGGKTPKPLKRSYNDDFSMNIPQEAKTHTKQGRGMFVQHFQAFQIVPIIKNIWENNRKILEYIFPIGKLLSWETFFIFTIPVSANKFRPLGMALGRNMPLLHPRTSGLLDILTANEKLKFYIDLQRNEGKNGSAHDNEQGSINDGRVGEIKEDTKIGPNSLISYASSLQERINAYMDQNKSFKSSSSPPGIRQWLEKKAGVIRQKMMGKRVNYSARTVIGPDPYLDTNEIGVPVMFALNLTIPERVGVHNISLMTSLVENGPSLYPGANKLQLGGIIYDLSRLNEDQRKAKAKLLLSSVLSASNPFQANHHPIVYRHLFDGDVVLMNRQPTLHRPSIMAHYIRIQPKDNIMRLNYVNCGTYNADFDGDEMNLHLPQSLFSRSEAKYIMDASRQYSVPKSGEPLRGLIQDSCIGGAFLTSKSTFLSREEYFHLLYTSLSFVLDNKSSALSNSPMINSTHGQVIFGSNNRYSEVNSPLGKVRIDELILKNLSSHNPNPQNNSHFEINFSKGSLDTQISYNHAYEGATSSRTNKSGHEINKANLYNNLVLEPPAIIRPIPLWTGKQVFTSLLKTLLYNLVSTEPEVYSSINLVSKSRTPGDSWNGREDGETEEAVVLIRNSELLQGVIDKNQIGSNSYCLVHLCTELVGPLIGGKLLSAIFNLSQAYLQMRGFTCSISDMLLTSKAESERIGLIRKYNQASVFIQEAFQHYIFKEIGGKNDLNHQTYFSDKYNDFLRLETVNSKYEEAQKIIKGLRNVKKYEDSSRMEPSNTSFSEHFNEFNTGLVDFSSDSKLVSSALEVLVEKLKSLNECNKAEKKILLKELVKSVREHKVNIEGLFKDKFERPDTNIEQSKQSPTVLYDESWLSFNKMEETVEDRFEREEGDCGACGDFFVYPNELTRRKLESLIGNKLSTRKDSLIKIMDAVSKIGLGDITSKLGNLLKGSSSKFPFPHNGFSSMVLTGAKGSRVNYNMICVMLGQQELEGRRVPIMPSMKTLPSFATYDLGSRAGGLITDRYLDGLHAQEFFFHCMSGREGLVDTAVKTARSGYLQRCILKGLESMIVHYDGTVRSEDDTIVQFIYGDDGIDVSKSSYLVKLEDLALNRPLLERDVKFNEFMKNKYLKDSFDRVLKLENKQDLFKTCLNQQIGTPEASPKRVKRTKENDQNKSLNSENPSQPSLSDMTVNSLLPTTMNGGSVSEFFLNCLSETNIQKLTRITYGSKYSKSTKTYLPPNTSKRKLKEPMIDSANSQTEFEMMLEMEKLLRLKYLKTQISPGEAVGCLAAQSIGEPATQMTLNTFHLAGHGAANVTLGIPRLKELLQTGGDSKTPYIFIPLLKEIQTSNQSSPDTKNGSFAYSSEKVLDCFRSIPLSDIIEKVGVESSIIYDESGQFCSSHHKKPVYSWNYEISLQFSNLETFCECLPQYNISSLINLTLSKCIKPFLRQVNNMYTLSSIRSSKFSNQDNDETDEFISKYVLGQANDRNIGVFKGALSSISQKGGISFQGGGIDGGFEDDFDSTSFKGKTKNSEGDNNKTETGEADNIVENEMEFDVNVKDDVDEEASSVDSSSSTSEEENGKDDDEDEAENDGLKARNSVLASDKFVDETVDDQNDSEGDEGITKISSDNGIEEGLFGESGPNNRATRINLKILTKNLLEHVTDIAIDGKTNILSLKIAWPVKRCPHYIDFLPVLKNIVSKTKIQSISNLKNARITRSQTKSKNEELSQFEITVEGTNVGHVFRISPSLISHDKIRFNDISTVFKYYGIEAARRCIIDELRNVFSVYGINVDYRHLSLISDSVTASGAIRVFNRMGTISHNISPFLQMSFETSVKFLTEACLRSARDNLKSPAGSISVGKMINVGTGISRTYTNINQNSSAKDSRKKDKKERRSKKKTKEDDDYFKFL